MHHNSSISPSAKIKVFGIGGGGSNAVSTMIRENIGGVDFICANTDIQSLQSSPCPTRLQIGKELTKGLGAGSNPEIGKSAVLEDRDDVVNVLSGADMVFITAGMGGGTGTGGAAVVAQIAKELGALTVGIVTKPFLFEGKKRRKQAEEGIKILSEFVDTLIVVPNERLIEIATPELSLIDAFKMADQVLMNAVKGISDIINTPGTVNVDFADVKSIMKSTGQALMGIGIARGKNRAIEAANQAISSPLLDDIEIDGASGVLINISAGDDITLVEINEACSIVQEAAHEDANIIFGAVIDPNLRDEIRITVIATGFHNHLSAQKSPVKESTYTAPTPTASPISKPRDSFESELNEFAIFSKRTSGATVSSHDSHVVTPPSLSPFESPLDSFHHFSQDKMRPQDDFSSLRESTLNVENSIDCALGFSSMSDSEPLEENLEVPAYIRRNSGLI